MGIANVVALKQVVKGHETAPVREVARAINIKLRLADQNENEALSHREEAGGMLVSLRARIEADGGDWWKFARDHFDRERRELERLMKYVPASEIAQAAVAANPQKSDRALAEEVGVSHTTVQKARRATGNNLPVVETRTGKDGKARKLPVKPAPAAADEAAARLAVASVGNKANADLADASVSRGVNLATLLTTPDPLIEQALQLVEELVEQMTAAQRKTFIDIIEGSYK